MRAETDMDLTVNTRTNNAILSLEGLSVGDAFGEMFFNPAAVDNIRKRQLPGGIWRWTDDTHMAISITEMLIELGAIQQDALVRRFAHRLMHDRRQIGA
jgi:ADP-ribosylglycohydrolase